METAGFTIHQLELGPMENFIYLVEDHATRRAAVVDPAWEVDKIIRLAEEKGLTISDVLLTHSHADHVNGVAGLLEHAPAQVHVLKSEADFWGKQGFPIVAHHGGDEVRLGKTPIQLLHTPGHTPGSACFHVHGQLLTGDTLFIYGCGRCDLRGGDPEAMYHTLKSLAEHFPAETRILPGHNYAHEPSTTLREQIAGNPFMHFHNVADFVRYRMVEHKRETPYGPVKNSEA